MAFFIAVLAQTLLLIMTYSRAHKHSFNVVDFGAINNDKIDSSKAFLDAWNTACNTKADSPMIIVPKGEKFLVNPVVFNGPCKAKNIDFMISGEIVAPESPSAWESLDPSQWLAFKDLRGLSLRGSGRVDGRGSGWWNQSCRYHPHLPGCTKLAPTAMKFLSCRKTTVAGLRFLNSSQTHISVTGSDTFKVVNVTIKSPGDSPNTDGIHLQSTRHVIIANTSIESGDDCVSVGDYTSNVNILNVKCGPGHGISIGSLGRSGNPAQVESIKIKDISFKRTTNGARIKTWQKAGRGYVRKIIFENLYFDEVKYPIIIDQSYCDVRGGCAEKSTGVEISDVTYKGLYGTSRSDVAVYFHCSSSVACKKITLDSVLLKASDPSKEATSDCVNAYGVARGLVLPKPCLQGQIHK
ncbi:hypothetical protein V2J09_017336 [Rumex salicifolius]